MWFGKTLLAAAVFSLMACSSDLVREEILPDNGRILSIEAYKGKAAADTRGLNQSSETSNINAIWSEGDYVTVLLLGVFLMNCTMPVTLYLANEVLKQREGLAFGLLAAALIPGWWLAVYG